jgi:hypothetical protein
MKKKGKVKRKEREQKLGAGVLVTVSQPSFKVGDVSSLRSPTREPRAGKHRHHRLYFEVINNTTTRTTQTLQFHGNIFITL